MHRMNKINCPPKKDFPTSFNTKWVLIAIFLEYVTTNRYVHTRYVMNNLLLPHPRLILNFKEYLWELSFRAAE